MCIMRDRHDNCIEIYQHGLPQRKYDPDKAKWHLKQAGLSRSIWNLVLRTPPFRARSIQLF